MLKLRDFFHLKEVDELVAALIQEESGLMVVTGPDLRTIKDGEGGSSLLASGRSGIFNIIVQEIMEANPQIRATYVTHDKHSARPARSLRKRVTLSVVEPPLGYAERIKAAMSNRPGLLIIDQLNPVTIPLAFKAAGSGLRVLSQLDSILWGSGVVQQFVDMGVTSDELRSLRWVLTVLRHATLCKHCKQAMPPEKIPFNLLKQRFPHLSGDLEKLQESSTRGTTMLFRAAGCAHCKGSGRSGDVTAFDISKLNRNVADAISVKDLMSIERYLLNLAEGGQVMLDDLLYFESNLLRDIYSLLNNREQELTDSTNRLTSKLFELEAANRVLQQRTEVVFSLQEMVQALISTYELKDLAARVCRYAAEICGAERAVLYYLRSGKGDEARAVVLAVNGWNQDLSGLELDAWLVFPQGLGADALPYRGRPPGIRGDSEDDPGDVNFSNGLLVPLFAQKQLVGLMIVHTSPKNQFSPGVVTLLQTFANQAALAMQRAGLIEELRHHIRQLEAAQEELVLKERMERELELAREVQQSVLPHTFPEVSGFDFAVRSQPARQVGGDFYDIFTLDENHFGILIADVSDKGMPAAVYMALARSLLLAEARRERSPKDVLLSVNRLLRELGEPSMFVSVFYAVVDAQAHKCTYTRAGHDRPLLVRGGELVRLKGHGAVLGTLGDDDLRLSEETVNLLSGDLLVLFTDGLPDAVDVNGTFYGLKRFEETLRIDEACTAKELCSGVFDAIATFQGQSEQFDDMTLVVLGVW